MLYRRWNHVRSWDDPWLPSDVTRRPTTYRGNNCELSMVDELIDFFFETERALY
jgi:hypothetical protein